ncbi:Ankyrin repeat domain-containing protein 50 [Trichoderma ghanense]|uniref:Ankyrin repeat domain-containing protein 50 n=1 Tax=Trichoderma ghanense TaxID=65468 RepID=A0ABY2H3T1_9HYPO
MKRPLTVENHQGVSNGREKRERACTDGRNLPEGEVSRKRNDEYTVGWICAVVTEYVAAEAVLDEIHGRPAKVSPASQSNYTLGRVGQHNVVIASLPFGEYGTASAATVATDMSHNFPNIKVRLMVGIGGGAPSNKHDIRLGDVVVSAPCNGHSGVMQYDFGKTVQDQPFQPTRYLDQPPMLLRTAMSGLAAQYERRGHSIQETVADILERRPLLQEKYSRPREGSDRLYSSTYVHPFDGSADCERTCADNSLVVRPPRISGQSLAIHYGLIASANQLMKDATVRDYLSSQYDVLCFEMEAGGLMNQFPCLVIRGICDYSDSHKNKAWQGYAAMTAAAYAKDLIARLSPSDSSVVQGSNNMGLSSRPQTTQDAPHTLSIEQKRQLLEALRFDQIDARQTTIKRAHSKTCQWLLHRPEYLDWLDPAKFREHHGFLWIKGKPGTGKSTLMKFALQNAQRKRGGKIIIHFFFNARGEHLEKSTVGMYRSILLQLLERIPALQDTVELPGSIARFGEDYHWNTEILTDLLEQAIQNLEGSNVVCFIDALDECEEDQVRDMIRFFENVGESITSGTFRVCFSSRHYPHITISKGLGLVLEGQEGHTQDITSFIDSELKIGREALATQLRTELREKAGGIFMWVVLVVGILNKEYDSGRVNDLRKRLRDIPGDLHELFRDILTRDSQNTNRLLLCVQWVLFAKQPLEPQQLYFALLSNEIYRWDTEEITLADMGRFILDSSKGLAETTKSKTPTVQFIHEAVKDYLLKEDGLKQIWSDLGVNYVAESHNQLKQCCVNYIALGQGDYLNAMDLKHKSSSPEAKAQREAVNSSFPFLQYAVKNIWHHANEAQAGNVNQAEFLKAFQLSDWVRLDNFLAEHDTRRHRQTVSMVYILAENNAAHLTKLFPARSFVVEESDRYGPPIFAALATDSREAVRAMLDAYVETEPSFRGVVQDYYHTETQQNSIGRGFEFRSRRALESISYRGATLAAVFYLTLKHDGLGPDERSQEALCFAVQGGHMPMLEYFFEHGAKPKPGSGDIQKLLSLAIEHRRECVAEFLLRNGATFDPLNEDCHAHFFMAAREGLYLILDMFLERGAEVDMRSKDRRTALSFAAESGGNRVSVAFLLGKGAEIDAKDAKGRTPLSYALSRYGNEAIVTLLLDHGAEVDARDSHGRTPLSYASENAGDSHIIINLLLDGGAEVDAKDNDGRTPLSYASERGSEGMIKALLDQGAEVDAKDEYGRTPLSRAAGNYAGSRGIGLLLAHGAEIDAKDNNGRTPLSYASEDYRDLKMLLDQGAEVDEKDQQGRTPLSYASSGGHPLVVSELLDKGAEVDAKDNNGRTPLSYASIGGRAATAELLLDKGADIDVKDDEGNTPLIYATSFEHNYTIRLLTKRGADIRAKNGEDKTPLQIAKAQKLGPKTIKMLQGSSQS